MLELLKTGLDFTSELLVSLWGLLCLVAGFGSELLTSLHTGAPRLEGLIIGVALAWLMLRREKHPLLRILSAPLKLILDILDLAWDQCVEVATDGWGVALGWAKKGLGVITGVVKGAWNKMIGLLTGIKNKLSRK